MQSIEHSSLSTALVLRVLFLILFTNMGKSVMPMPMTIRSDYSSCSPDNCDVDRESMEHCLRYIRQWMQSMNDSKTEYTIFGTQQSLAKCHTTSITIGDSTIEASDHIRNLGAYFDKNMSMAKHVKIKCQTA